jgi:hypothetical protein
MKDEYTCSECGQDINGCLCRIPQFTKASQHGGVTTMPIGTEAPWKSKGYTIIKETVHGEVAIADTSYGPPADKRAENTVLLAAAAEMWQAIDEIVAELQNPDVGHIPTAGITFALDIHKKITSLTRSEDNETL